MALTAVNGQVVALLTYAHVCSRMLTYAHVWNGQVVVTEVSPDGSAARGNGGNGPVHKGDVILSVDGRSPPNLSQHILTYPHGC